MKSFQKQARQGDVILARVAALPANLVPVDREHGKVVLAHGEVTGHMHAISEAHVAQFRAAVETPKSAEFVLRAGGMSGFTWLKVDKPAVLRHDEHDPIQLEPGCYEVRRQREYRRGEIRNVAD